MLRTHPMNLDPATKKYLRGIGTAQGSGCNGIYIRRGTSLRGAVIFAIILLIVAMVCFMPSIGPSAFVRRAVQTGCFALGMLILASCWHTRRSRKDTENHLGTFFYADAMNFWDVTPHNVRATDLSGVVKASATHLLVNGSYQRTSFQIQRDKGKTQLCIINRAKGDELLRYLNIIGFLRTESEPAEQRQALRANPALLMAVARKIYNGKDAPMPQVGEPLPTPSVVPAMQKSHRRMLQWTTFLLACVVGHFFFPAIEYRIRDEYAFMQLKRNPTATAADDYLSYFSQGAHAQAATAIRDDCMYKLAADQAAQDHSPKQLRDYLVDPTCIRHRTEAQAKVNEFYDEAIARVKQLSADKQVDPQLFGGFMALLDSLKTAQRPVVTVSFHATQDADNTTDDERKTEDAEQAKYVEHYPGVQAIIDNSPEKTAVLSRGETFNTNQIHRRENVILARLSDSISGVLNADLIQLEPATAGARGMIDVSYYTHPSGELYILRTWDHTDAAAAVDDSQKKVEGLLRGYVIDWDIRIRSAGDESASAKEFCYKLHSSPAQSMHLTSQPTDPTWSPYAVMLYSAFYDLSGQLIANFGLTPPDAPTSFTFAEATGTAAY
jgi:hypothetical protein